MVRVVKMCLMSLVIVVMISYLAARLGSIGNASFILAILILVLGLILLKRWFPFVFNLLKRLFVFGIKAVAGYLWKKPEKKGGANIRQPKMRWRL